jgi:hypothetical protein
MLCYKQGRQENFWAPEQKEIHGPRGAARAEPPKRTINHLSPQIIEHKIDHDICRWKSMA